MKFFKALFIAVVVMATIVAGYLSYQSRTSGSPTREELVKSQFSRWDGSHAALVKVVKDAMKDPSSFEHLETSFRDEGRYAYVVMKYRGVNSFGAVVPGRVAARVDMHGRVVEVVEQD